METENLDSNSQANATLNKCNKTQFILFIILTLASFVTIGFLYYQNVQLRKQINYQTNQKLTIEKPTANQTVNQNNTLVNLEVPLLPNFENWVVDIKTNKIEVGCLDDNFELCSENNSPIYLKGKNYVYTEKFQTFDELQRRPFNTLGFDTKLEELGWKESVSSNGYTFSFGHGDGPFDSTGGVLAINDKIIRGIKETTSVNVTKGTSMPDVTCPCTITTQIFISDEIPITELVGSTSIVPN